jgi:4-aminobutyrate aminotransferase-like enzyme
MWGFEAFGVTPDIVTMGKPMGNGHPVAAVATRRDIAERFRRSTGYFNTFGGNPVSCAVANAVLDVLHAPGFCDQVLRVGEHLCEGLKELVGRHHVIGHVHGRGLFYGIELVTDRSSRAPARHAARWVRERMRQNGVLIASTGPLGNILKIRPPLAMSCDDANLCLEVLEEAVSHLPPETLIND